MLIWNKFVQSYEVKKIKVSLKLPLRLGTGKASLMNSPGSSSELTMASKAKIQLIKKIKRCNNLSEQWSGLHVGRDFCQWILLDDEDESDTLKHKVKKNLSVVMHTINPSELLLNS